MKKVTSITLHDNPTTAAKATSVGSVSNILLNCEKPADVYYKLGNVHTLTLHIGTGTPFGQEVYDNDWFNEFDSIKVTWNDTSVEWWRVESRKTKWGDAGEITVVCQPYWTMLARRRLRIFRDPTGIVDTTLTMHLKTATQVLTEILSYNAPPYFAVGNVETSLATGLVDVEANNSTHLSLVQQLCKKLAEYNGGFTAEFEIRWVGAVAYIDIVPWTGASSAEVTASYVADPDSRIISGGKGSDPANRLMNSVTRGASDAYNRIIPTAGDKQTPVTIGPAAWMVSVISSVGGGVYECTLAENPFGGAIDIDAAETIYFGSTELIDLADDTSGTIGFFAVTATSIGSPHKVRVTGDPANLLNRRGRFAVDSSGQELVYLGTAAAVGDDISEAVAHFPDVVPYDNLLEDAGVSTDFSTWSAGLPVGTTKVGTATITEILASAEPGHVRNGTSAAKIECDAANGARIGKDLLSLVTDGAEKLFSFTLNVAVESGRVRAVLVDSEGRRHPQGVEQAESKFANVRSVAKGGFDAGDGAAYIEILAMEDGTVFYLDSVNVTRSVGAWPYSGKQGPRALWKSARETLTEQAVGRDFYDTKYIDPKYITAGQEIIEIGSHVRIKDGYESGAYRVSVTGRVRELKLQLSSGSESIMGVIKVAKPRPDFTNRLASGGIVGLPGLSSGIEQPGDFFESVFTANVEGELIATLAARVLKDQVQRTNVFKFSQNLENAVWSKTLSTITQNAAIAPDGTLTADKLVLDATAANTHSITQAGVGVVITASKKFCCSISLKKDDLDWFRIQVNNGCTTNCEIGYAYFDLTNGAVGTVGWQTGAPTSYVGAITDEGDGWYRCSLSVEFTSASDNVLYANLFLAEADGDYVINGDSTKGVFMWGLQLEEILTTETGPSDYITTFGSVVARVPGVTELTLDVLADAEYGTELEIRSFGDIAPVPFFLNESINDGDLARIVPVSAATPVYTEGFEGDPAYVLNQEEVSVSATLEVGTAIVAPTVSLLSRIYQQSDLIELLQRQVKNSLTLTQIAVLGEDAEGSVTSLELSIPTRVALRAGWQINVLTNSGVQPAMVQTDTSIGAYSIPVVAESLSALAGDSVAMDPIELLAYLRIEPGEIKLSVEKGKKQTSLATLNPLIAAGATTSLALEGTLKVALADNASYIIEDQNGATLTIVINGAHSVGATSLTVDSVVIPSGGWINGYVRLPEYNTQNSITVNEAGILLRVQYADVISSINLSSEGITIQSDNIAIDGATTFATYYDPSDKAKVSRQASAPSSPNVSDLWLDTGDTTLWRWSGSAWVAVGTDDTAWRHATDYTKIDGGKIYTGSVTTTQLNFTPATSTNVIATINASLEGIVIQADNIEISGSTTFSAGYDPSTKAATTYSATAPSSPATGDLWNDTSDSSQSVLKRWDGTVWNNIGFIHLDWAASADKTKIEGGNIYTKTITAASIATGTITIAEIGFDASTTYRQSATPSPVNPGDTWLDTGDLTLWRRNDANSAWEAVGTDDLAWRHATDYTKIDGGKIYTGSVTTSELNFVPVQSTDVIAKINASAEGIVIAADNIEISGSTTFTGNGYDPSEKVRSYRQPTEPTTPVPQIGDLWLDTTDSTLYRLTSTGPNVWSAVGTDDTGWRHPADYTQIDGGDIYTNTVTAAAIFVSDLNAINVNTGVLTISDTLTLGAAGKIEKIGVLTITDAGIDISSGTSGGDLTRAITWNGGSGDNTARILYYKDASDQSTLFLTVQDRDAGDYCEVDIIADGGATEISELLVRSNAAGDTLIGLYADSIDITGDINHDGTKVGLYSAAPVVQAAAITALTDSTTGTGNNTVAEVIGSGIDGTINDNFADLIGKVNSILTALKNIGITA